MVTRRLEVGARKRPGLALLHAVGFLTVQFEIECCCDAIFFKPQAMMGRSIANGYGFIQWGCPVELVLWAYEEEISFLELEPKMGGLTRPRGDTHLLQE